MFQSHRLTQLSALAAIIAQQPKASLACNKCWHLVRKHSPSPDSMYCEASQARFQPLAPWSVFRTAPWGCQCLVAHSEANVPAASYSSGQQICSSTRLSVQRVIFDWAIENVALQWLTGAVKSGISGESHFIITSLERLLCCQAAIWTAS